MFSNGGSSRSPEEKNLLPKKSFNLKNNKLNGKTSKVLSNISNDENNNIDDNNNKIIMGKSQYLNFFKSNRPKALMNSLDSKEYKKEDLVQKMMRKTTNSSLNPFTLKDSKNLIVDNNCDKNDSKEKIEKNNGGEKIKINGFGNRAQKIILGKNKNSNKAGKYSVSETKRMGKTSASFYKH